MTFVRVSILLLILALTSACNAGDSVSGAPTPSAPTANQAITAAGSCALDLPEPAQDDDSIRAVLEAEGEFVVAQNIESLMRLWADNGRVVDAKNTPNDTADNQQWEGKDAIRHRYVHIVFPGAPSAAQPADLAISLEPERATVQSTTQIGSEISPGGDLWVLVKLGDCWLIESLTYNLETSP